MQSALPKRWRGLKTVETALLGGRGPIASPALNFAREYKRPRKPRCGDHRPLAPKRVKSVRGSRRRTLCVLENSPCLCRERGKIPLRSTPFGYVAGWYRFPATGPRARACSPGAFSVPGRMGQK